MTSGKADDRSVVYAAFKGMGDLLSAAPVIKAELDAGAKVALLLFPQIGSFLELIDFGPNAHNLQPFLLPVSGRFADARQFLRQMAALSPQLVWISPHSPRPAASWKIPLLLWVVRRLKWPSATLGGIDSEPLSWLFDSRIHGDRDLPFALREWTSYSVFAGFSPATKLAPITFKREIQELRYLPPAYDLLIHPGAGAENRKWPLNKHAELLSYLPADWRIAVLGLRSDIDAMKEELKTDRIIQYLTGTLEDAISAIARARVALTMDSGTTFFASVLGIPAVALFGASDPGNIIGFETTIRPIYELNWPCQPCGRARCSQKLLYCMESLEPARVAAAIIDLLRTSLR